MSKNDADAIAEVAALCVAAHAKLPASGFHRLRVLLDMLLIDLSREVPPQDQPEPAIPMDAAEAPDRT